MLAKLKIIGEEIRNNEGDQNILRLDTTLQSGYVICLAFQLDSTQCQFLENETDVIEFDQSKNRSILLKPAPANTRSEYPSYRIASNKDPELQRENVIKVMKKMGDTLANCSEKNPQLKPLHESFTNNVNNIIEVICSKIDPNQKNICTIKINNKLPGDSEYFQPIIEQFLENQFKEYYEKYGGTQSIGKNNVCYICGQFSQETYGYCSTYPFYSSNEFAYIAGGFRREDSWKNYPVCPTCAKDLYIGKDWLTKHFDRKFYGIQYLLIPAPTIEQDNFYSILDDIKRAYIGIDFKKTAERNLQRQMEMEEEVFEVLASQKNQATFTFIFYNAKQSEFKILQEAEDILPSRFERILAAKKQVEKHNDFHNISGLHKDKTPDNLKFNFGIIKNFFSSEYNNDFLDITTKILKNRPLDRSFILHQIANVISEKFRIKKLRHEILEAMLLMKFLYELKLIELSPNRMEVQMSNHYQNYFLGHPEFYDADWKKAVFLLGVLAQNVLDIQWQERNATPFRDRLNGLRIDYHTVKRLYPECINKLEQYKKNYYRELEEIIAVLLESGEPDLRNQSVDEISFYFAMGLNRNKIFKAKEEQNNGGSNE